MNARHPGPPRVLVVDDDPHLVLAINDILNDAGYETRTAADGHAAIQRFPMFLPDVIVLDLMMPVVNGFEVLDWLKQHEAIGGSTRIVIEQGPSAGVPSTSPPLGKLSRAGRGGAPHPPRRDEGRRGRKDDRLLSRSGPI